jgi:hypothetical protein
MLWTVVVALYLSIVTVFQVDLIIFAVLTVWFLVVGLFRIGLSSKAAWASSVVAGAVLFGGGMCVDCHSPGVSWIELLTGALPMGMSGGALYGCMFFLIVEAAFRFVDWADNKMRSKAHE